jgi:hypothetical protein
MMMTSLGRRGRTRAKGGETGTCVTLYNYEESLTLLPSCGRLEEQGEVTSSYLERAREARKTEESAEERWSSERPMVREGGNAICRIVC